MQIKLTKSNECIDSYTYTHIRKEHINTKRSHSDKRSSSGEMKIDLKRVGIYTEHGFDTY